MSKYHFTILMGIATTMLMALVIGNGLQTTYAEPIMMDVNKTEFPRPGFGNEKIGTVSIDPKENTLDISINLTETPAQDKVFEAWLVDAGGSGYKLSLGAIDGDSLKTSDHMVNPYTYSEFMITEEPVDDLDPNAADTYAGTELQTPFGR